MTLGRLFSAIGLLITLAHFTTASPETAGSSSPDAQSPWRKQEPIPTPWDFADVDMISTLEGWAVSQPVTGDHASIFHTNNAGHTWKQQGLLFRQLNGVSFADALHGVAVGNECRYTRNGGDSWLLSSTAPGTLFDVDLVDQNTGYACGFGAVWKTVDGGQTWTHQSIPLSGNFVAIDFVNVTTGWVVGAEGSVYKSDDGGSTWIRQRNDSSAFYTGVSFVSATEGWVCGNSTMLHTTDGGTTWAIQRLPAGADATEVRFVDSQNGHAAGALRTLLHTTDGGQTWTTQDSGASRIVITGVTAVTPATAWIAGWDGFVAGTRNAGQTWRRETVADAGQTDFEDLFFVDSRRGWVGGNIGIWGRR